MSDIKVVSGAQMESNNLKKPAVAKKKTTFRSRYANCVYMLPDGKHVQFMQGLYSTDDDDIVAYLTAHRDFKSTLYIGS